MSLPFTSKQFWMGLWSIGLVFFFTTGSYLVLYSVEGAGAGVGLITLGIVFFVAGMANMAMEGWIQFKEVKH